MVILESLRDGALKAEWNEVIRNFFGGEPLQNCLLIGFLLGMVVTLAFVWMYFKILKQIREEKKRGKGQ